MLHHARRIAVLAIAIAVLGGALAPNAAAQTVEEREPTLRERLLFGLQARRPSERAFVEAVADTVERGDLDQRLVDRLFFWARTRPPHGGGTTRPVVAFQAALERIAARQKIVIEPSFPRTPS